MEITPTLTDPPVTTETETTNTLVTCNSDRGLSEKIWITRKARIESAERYERIARWSQRLIVYYSVCNIVFAILDIANPNRDFTYQLLIASVVTLTISIYLPSRAFEEKALALKRCYVSLSGLYRQAKDVESNESKHAEINRIWDEYDKILLEHENQSIFDYYLAVYRARGNGSTYSLRIDEYAMLAGYWIFNVLVVMVLFALPFILYFSIS